MKIELLKTCLTNFINNIDCGNTNISEEQCDEIIDIINHMTISENKYSKYQACKYLGISRATFDNYVRLKIIPKGRKQQGFKELFWIKRDLDLAKTKINVNKTKNDNS